MSSRKERERVDRNNKLLLQKKKQENITLPEPDLDIEQYKGELKKSKSESVHLHSQWANAFRSIDQLIKRIAELESSRIYKLKRFLSFYTKRLRSNFKKGDKKNFFVIIYNYVFKRGIRVARIISAKILKHVYLIVEIKKVVIIEVFSEMLANTADYSQYLYRKQINKSKRKFIVNQIKNFKQKPVFSIIIPVYDPPIDFFTQALDSIIGQIYPHWEICLADDCSKDQEVKELIEEYCLKHSTIKVIYRSENGHISRASNSALELATGEYSVLMDQDDLLREDALFEMAKLINQKQDGICQKLV